VELLDGRRGQLTWGLATRRMGFWRLWWRRSWLRRVFTRKVRTT
jgi:hypothetical protein